MYDKIKALISRNDFTTAEKLLDRHSTDLSERQKRELRDFIAEQQRNKQRDDLKRNKRLKLSGHWRAGYRKDFVSKLAYFRLCLISLWKDAVFYLAFQLGWTSFSTPAGHGAFIPAATCFDGVALLL